MGHILGRPRPEQEPLVLLLWIVAGILTALSIGSYFLARSVEGSHALTLWDVYENLSLGVEFNLPTWYASVLWVILAAAAWGQSVVDRPRRAEWTLFAAIAVVGSIDAYLMLHDRLSRPGGAFERGVGLNLAGATWVLVGLPAALIVAALLIPLIKGLPLPVRRDVLLGGSVFILGAVGFEVISSLSFATSGPRDWRPVMLMHMEEALEFAGVILAIRGLVRLPCFRQGSGSNDPQACT